MWIEKGRQLLIEFNEAMKQQLIEMRKRAIDLYNNVYKPDMIGRIEVVGICFMRYGYSKLHGTLFNYLLGTLLLHILPS